MLYDITRNVTTDLAVWPGDSPFNYQMLACLEDGASVNLTNIVFSAHTGTHADAFFHFEEDGEHPNKMPLAAYIGPARVVTVSRQDGPLTPADFSHVNLAGAERLLIHSHVSNLPDQEWPLAFPYLSVELVDWLAEQEIRLIGLDSPSVDAFDSTDLPCHHALYRHKIVNLESLLLRGVPDGDYWLSALPLKLDEVCGSPVRAVLYQGTP